MLRWYGPNRSLVGSVEKNFISNRKTRFVSDPLPLPFFSAGRLCYTAARWRDFSLSQARSLVPEAVRITRPSPLIRLSFPSTD